MIRRSCANRSIFPTSGFTVTQIAFHHHHNNNDSDQNIKNTTMNNNTPSQQQQQQRDELPALPAAYDWEDFRRNGHTTIDYIADYYKALNERRMPVQSQVQPGYLREALPGAPPQHGQPWDETLRNVDKHVRPGITHWQHPDFFGFFPAMASPPAMLGELLGTSFNNPGFNWVCSPASTELELVMTDWLVQAFGFDMERYSWTAGRGGGVLQPSATEAIIVAMLSAKDKTLRQLEEKEAGGGSLPESNIAAAAANVVPGCAYLDKLVAYYGDQAHFCVEKAGRVLSIPHMRKIPSVWDESDFNYTMDAAALDQQIQDDVKAGLLPFFVSASFGATGTCTIDPIEKIRDICAKHNLWFNIDAAYAGVTAICPEMRELARGLDSADSLLINGSKWFSTLFNANFFFFADRAAVVKSLNSTAVYLSNPASDSGKVVDLKDYQLGLGRPFRSLKIYATLESFGIDGLQSVIRRHVILAKYLERKLEDTGIFDIAARARFGLVCFRLKKREDCAENEEKRNMDLLNEINASQKAFMVHTMSGGEPVLRVSLAHPQLDYAAMDALVDLILVCAKVKN